MGLTPFINPNAKNKFCSLKNLRNESDVEQFLIKPLLEELGFTEDYLETKSTIKSSNIGKRKKRKTYSPDFIGYSDKLHEKPILIVDAKHPTEDPEDGVADSQLYASVLRRSLSKPKPEQYCMGSNGVKTIVKHYDSITVEFELDFRDMQEGNAKYEAFKNEMNRIALTRSAALSMQPFEFKKPDLDEIKGIFETCHNVIWHKEVTNPQSAFYEFSKLMFVKLSEDKRLRKNADTRKLIEEGKPLPQDRVLFSVYWIEANEEAEPNPINTILFRRIRDDIELEILQGKKKRVFDKTEKIDLKPSTIKEVVRLLEHYDLYGIDEDLNGRLFETFLGATMRGKELGQFFTPRSVVEFMTKLADPYVGSDKIDNIIDACCGTGGFLIEAMAYMTEKLQKPPLSRTINPKDRMDMIKQIRDDKLLGIDLGKNPPVARIARINMYLHGDGGSRIYFADGLDKQVRIEETIEPELKAEREQLNDLIVKKKTKFQVALTNPPFAMRYKRDDPDQGPILREYALAKTHSGKSVSMCASLKSSIMFLERYSDLLDSGCKLVTIMDEAVLNTAGAERIRRWLLQNFIIRAIISLPRNTFIKAESVVKTSILYLIKKEKDEKQDEIFMAKSENVGHTDSGREMRELSDLDEILANYRAFEQGKFVNSTKPHCFLVSDLFTENRTLRLDAQYFDPNYPATLGILRKLAKREGWKLEPLGNLLVDTKTKLAGGATPRGARYVEKGIPFIRIQNVKPSKLDLSDVKQIIRAFHEQELKRSQLKPDDVLLTITGSYGISAVVPTSLGEANINQHVVKMEIDTSRIRPEYLACFLNTQLCKKQFDRAATGGTRPALDYKAIKATMILYPTDLTKQDKIVKEVYSIQSKARAILDEAKNKEVESKSVLMTWDNPFIV